MLPLINPAKQKTIIVAIAFLVCFFGLEAAGNALHVYQVDKFLLISFYVYLFLVFWTSFIFDLHLKKTYTWQGLEKSIWGALKGRFRYMIEKHHFLNYQNYLILPAVIYWSVVTLLYLNPFDPVLKQAFIIGGSLAIGVTTWYLKTVFYDHHNAHHTVRQIIFIVKLIAAFFSFAAAYGLTIYYGVDILTFSIGVFGLSFLLFHQAFFQHHYNGFKTVEIFSVCGLIMAWTAGLIFLFWNVNYFSGALIITAVYTTAWGIVQHKFIDRNLTREIVYEYLSVLFVILVLTASLTNFREKLPPPDQDGNQSNYHETR